MLSVSIQGTLKLTAPLHVAAFENSWRLTDDRRPIQGDAGGKPLTRTQKQPLVDKDNIFCEVPFLFGNGFRGRLRRYAQRRVQKTIGPVSIDTYHGLSCGAVSAKPSKETRTISASARAASNVYLGLFGGSPGLYPSHYSVCDLVPVTDTTIGIGRVPERYAEIVPIRCFGKDESRPARPDELLFFLDFVRVDDALRFRDPQAPLLIAGYEDALAGWIAEVNDNRQAVAASKEAVAANKEKKAKDRTAIEKVSKSSLDAMAAIEAIIPGVHMYFRLDLDESVDDAQAGLMMLCVADLVNRNCLGGWGRCGLGRFDAKLFVIKDGEEQAPLLDYDGSAYRVHPELERYESAAQDALDALDGDDIADFFKEQ